MQCKKIVLEQEKMKKKSIFLYAIQFRIDCVYV